MRISIGRLALVAALSGAALPALAAKREKAPATSVGTFRYCAPEHQVVRRKEMVLNPPPIPARAIGALHKCPPCRLP